MIPVNLAVIAALYGATRFGKFLWKRRSSSKERLNNVPLPLSDEDDLQVHMHHARTSGVAIIGTIAGYFYPPLILTNVALIGYTNLPVLQRAEHAFRKNHKLGNDAYCALLHILCLTGGSYFGAASSTLLYHLSCRYVKQSKQDSGQLIDHVYGKQKNNVWVLRDDCETEISLDQLHQGETLLVGIGETIPVDGIVISGSALVDQQCLTGETTPIEITPDTRVKASGLVIAGRLTIHALQNGRESRLRQLNDALKKTREFKSQLQLKGEAWADWVVKPITAGSLATIPVLGLGPASALLFSSSVCTVRSTLALYNASHLNVLTERNVLIKDGRVFEELPKIDTILFDKTGTLTLPQPSITSIICCHDWNEDQLLTYAATAEQHLQHPIADAIIHEARQRRLDVPAVAVF